MKTWLLILLLPLSLKAQVASTTCPTGVSHCVVLTVGDQGTSSTVVGVATILRAGGECPATGIPQVATILTASLRVMGTGTYQDNAHALATGRWCYFALVRVGSMEKVSDTFQAEIP